MDFKEKVESFISGFLAKRQEGIEFIENMLKELRSEYINGKIVEITDVPLTWHLDIKVKDVGILKIDIPYSEVKKKFAMYDDAGYPVESFPENEFEAFKSVFLSQLEEKLKL